MHLRTLQEDDVIRSPPKKSHLINGGCAEEEVSPNLKSPEQCRACPHEKQIDMMESRGIKVAKDSSHAGPPDLPKGKNRGALSPQILNSLMNK
ncbi:hypothetical protein O181_113497 [Austropuccinia psidii MF-1]|uniref:Uncharacterized protein n=1 Tax=Austropuccinia psidii MF-1 TaxID=1389203 RepID=A0A9Q3K5R6_9BASI|nr:hypothetical protein [Austropuccinia psidii MF-1]